MPEAVANWPELKEIADGVRRLGKTPAQCAALVAAVVEAPQTQQPVRDIKDALRAEGVPCSCDGLERVLRSHAMEHSATSIDALPVPASER